DHGLFAFGSGLYPLFDIAAVVQHASGCMDWAALAARSRTWGVERCLFLMLAVTERLLAPGIPEQILACLEPPDYDPALATMALHLMTARFPQRCRTTFPALTTIRCRPHFERLSPVTRVRTTL